MAGIRLAFDMRGGAADPIDVGDGGSAEFQHQQGHGLIPACGLTATQKRAGPCGTGRKRWPFILIATAASNLAVTAFLAEGAP